MHTPSQAMVDLPHYGIHNVGGLLYLFQDNLHEGWNFVGSRYPSNASVRGLGNKCSHVFNPHQINLKISQKHWDKFAPLLDDPLVQAMLPLPARRQKAYYLPSSAIRMAPMVLATLERLNNPLHHQTKALWATTDNKVVRALEHTNIHPICLHSAGIVDSDRVRRLLTQAQLGRRHLIIEGFDDILLPDHVQVLETKVTDMMPLEELAGLPLEHIGLEIVARYCRGVDL